MYSKAFIIVTLSYLIVLICPFTGVHSDILFSKRTLLLMRRLYHGCRYRKFSLPTINGCYRAEETSLNCRS